MKASMVDYYENELGELDFNRSINGTGISKCSSIKELVGVLQQVSDRKKSTKFSIDELKQIIQVRRELVKTRFSRLRRFMVFIFKASKMTQKPVSQVIDSLNHQCYLIKKGPNMYEFSSANF